MRKSLFNQKLLEWPGKLCQALGEALERFGSLGGPGSPERVWECSGRLRGSSGRSMTRSAVLKLKAWGKSI